MPQALDRRSPPSAPSQPIPFHPTTQLDFPTTAAPQCPRNVPRKHMWKIFKRPGNINGLEAKACMLNQYIKCRASISDVRCSVAFVVCAHHWGSYIHDCVRPVVISMLFPPGQIFTKHSHFGKIHVEEIQGRYVCRKNTCGDAPQRLVILCCYLGLFGTTSELFGLLS